MDKDIANHWHHWQGTIYYLELAIKNWELCQASLTEAIRDLQEVQRRLLKASGQVKEANG